MEMQAYISEIKLHLSGYVLKLEINDDIIAQIVNSAFREIQRYIDTTKIATIPYSPCIDLSNCGVSSVSRIFRAKSYLADTGDGKNSSMSDPMYAAQWQILSGAAGAYNLSDWIYNYSSWNTMLQLRNTMSTDLTFRFDRSTSKLYINVGYDRPNAITIEYVPRYNDVSEIVSDFWIDKLLQLSLALAKVTIGRIRTRFNQSNALWTQDGDNLLSEGNESLISIREELKKATQLVYPID